MSPALAPGIHLTMVGIHLTMVTILSDNIKKKELEKLEKDQGQKSKLKRCGRFGIQWCQRYH